jgi:hypothetical protein
MPLFFGLCRNRLAAGLAVWPGVAALHEPGSCGNMANGLFAVLYDE